MIVLVAALAINAAEYRCKIDDASCWMAAALAQQERAERAEAKVLLLEEAVSIGKRLLAEADARGDRWQKIAEKIAPKDPPVWERPTFWLAVGVAAGCAATVGVTYAVNHPR